MVRTDQMWRYPGTVEHSPARTGRRRRETDMFTLPDLRILIEGLGTLMAEYGETPERLELQGRLYDERDRRIAELEQFRLHV